MTQEDQSAGGQRPSLLRGMVGVALVLLGVGGWMVASKLAAPPEGKVIDGNFPVNAGAADPRDISAHNSPTLVANPVDPSNLAIANRIDTPRFSCAFHLSFDAGASWGQTPIPVPAGEQPKCYAPDVAFGADGTLYLSYVTLKGRGNVPNAVWLATSADGGRTLSEPSRILGPLSFQVRLVADPDLPERLYLTWVQASQVSLYRFAETGNPVSFARSDDGGVTWQGPVEINDPARERVVAPSLAVGPGGLLYVLYLDMKDDRLDYEGGHEGRGGPPYPGTFALVLASSRDSGATWSERELPGHIRPIERFLVFLPAFPSLAVDRAGEVVYAAYHDARLGDPDVWAWASDNGGESFSGPVRVNDTEEGDGTTQELPRLSVAPNGRLDVVYYDRRGDPEDVMTEVALQSSYDAGRSFTPRVTLSDVSFDSTIGFGSERDMPELGSRLGLFSTDERALAVWSDTRNGVAVSRKQDLVRAVVAFGEPPALHGTTGAALRYAGLGLAGVGLLVMASSVLSRARLRGSASAPGS